MRTTRFMLFLLLGCPALGCGSTGEPSSDAAPTTDGVTGDSPAAGESTFPEVLNEIAETVVNESGVVPSLAPPGLSLLPPVSLPRRLELHLLYVHGVQNCPDERLGADASLDELQAAVEEELPRRIAGYEAAHPGVELAATSAHANLYTAKPSGFQPLDSADPINMDDWEVGDVGCTATQQGEPCTTAFEWRFRLVQEMERLFGPDATNIVLIGHSTGARAAFEVTANVGSAGIDSHDWGVQDRILGVVSVHGMIDALGSIDYEFAAPASFESSCKFGDLITGFGSRCAHGNGWCEYAQQASARDAVDWVSQRKHALVLSSFADCLPSLFGGATDGPLPVLAQASPLSTGLRLVPGPGRTLAGAHGEDYGSFCHSAITSPGVQGHASAIAAARERLLDWLFVTAQRVRATGSVELEALEFDRVSSPIEADGICEERGRGSKVDIVGVCRHPGSFDGDDHAISDDEWLPGDADCPSAIRWTQAHDPGQAHAARVIWKTYEPEQRGGVLGN